MAVAHPGVISRTAITRYVGMGTMAWAFVMAETLVRTEERLRWIAGRVRGEPEPRL